jgi:hypothetical protein
MAIVTERFNPLAVGVNSTSNITGAAVGGFLAYTNGTVTITKSDGTVVVNALPVTAGVFHPIPFYIGHNGGTVTTAGGASGVLGV